jgi:hypothetical protein
MKKKITIIVSLIISLSSLSQVRFQTKDPCTESMLLEVKGKWIKTSDIITGSSNVMTQEVINRMDAMHKIVFDLYPKPMGVDAVWHRSGAGIGLFANQVVFERNNHGLNANPVKGTPVVQYYYHASFYDYFCVGDNEIMSGWPGEGNGWITITANIVEGFYSSDNMADNMTVDGRPVKFIPPVKETWKGDALLLVHGSGAARQVLIHRKGILPYIPVTRKQYFDFSIYHLIKFYDEAIQSIETQPVRSLEEQEAEKNKVLAKYERDYGKDPKRLKSATDYYLSGYQTDQQRRDEDKNKIITVKDEVLKRYRDELEKTTTDGMLDSPAIVLSMYQFFDMPIFTKETEGGRMLVTENPDYIRKELPKYAPQIIVLLWWGSSSPAQENIRKIIEANFPIEKLQAMIDK